MNNNKTGFNFDNTYKNLPNIFYTEQNAEKVNNPRLVKFNYELAKDLGLKSETLINDEGINIFSGNNTPEGASPLAQAYAGHQFGHFTMLGDGRALLIGEHIDLNGERYDIQLKGSGRTPYSRGGDGKASLGPMLREYIISEAMHFLKIPTTRSLAVATTGESVIRDDIQKGAILTRVSKSHIRVGTFQYAANWASVDELKRLADYTIDRHFKEYKNSENPYLLLLKEVVNRQAELVSKWQLIGFIHGVMNTDNMTISGETIDYGPCAFMDIYDPNTVFSSIDYYGRYAYGNQPNIAGWNLARFAETLLPLLDSNRDKAIILAQEIIADFQIKYRKLWLKGMRIKLGLFNEEDMDEKLIEALLSMMQEYKADFTNTFRALTNGNLSETKLFGTDEFVKWYELWRERLSRQEQSSEKIKELMEQNNPTVIPRNNLVEEALSQAVKNNDYSTMDKLLEVLSNPYDYTKEYDEHYIFPEESKTPYRTFCGT